MRGGLGQESSGEKSRLQKRSRADCARQWCDQINWKLIRMKADVVQRWMWLKEKRESRGIIKRRG